MAWMGIAASVVGSMVSGAMQGDAAGEASDAQGQSSAAAVREQRRQYDLTRKDSAPWRDTGSAAQKRLAVLLGIGPKPGPGSDETSTLWGSQYTGAPTLDSVRQAREDAWMRNNGMASGGADEWMIDPTYQSELARWNSRPHAEAADEGDYGALNKKFTLEDRDADPVYQSGLEFGLREGVDGINARALAGGRYDSGATLKALTRFGNDYGSTKANESRNRFVSDQDSIYNRLAGVSSSGQTATAQVGAAGSNMANNVSELMTGAGNARAAGIVGGANAWGGAAGGVNNAISNYQNNQTLQKLLAGGGSSGSSWSPSGQWWGSSGENF